MKINKTKKYNDDGLEALAVDNSGAGLVVLFLGDPHGLEGGEGSEDGATDPDGVFTLGGSNDLDLDGGGSEGGDLLLHTISNTRVHGGAARHYVVCEKVLTNIDITSHDGVKDSLVNTNRLHTQKRRLEESFWSAEPFIADGNNLTVGEFIRFVNGR